MFEIAVNGQIFSNWKSAALTRTLDENAGKFQFTSSNVIPRNYPVRAGDAVQILINDQPRLTGFCETLTSLEEEGEDRITITGRDSVGDLIDSSMPDSVKSIVNPLSLEELCRRVIEALGANIPVVVAVPNLEDFSETDFFGADAGKGCISYLTDFARKRQVYLISNGAGGLVIFRPSETLLPGNLINRIDGAGNNVLSSSIRLDHSQRFGSYSSRSQDNFGADPNADYDAGVDRQGSAVDDEIRESRFLELQGEESLTDPEATDRAVEELNIRRARSTAYTAVVPGVERANGVLWDIGQLTKVKDEKRNVQGIFVVRSVGFTVDKEGGTKTKLVLAPPEAYNVRIPTQGDTRRAEQGGAYQAITGDAAVRRFIRQ